MIGWWMSTKRHYCCVPVMLHKILLNLVELMQPAMQQSMDSMPGTLNVHRPLIMELMLWLMMRSAVLCCSSDGFDSVSDDEGCAVAEIFGFALVHFVGIQG